MKRGLISTIIGAVTNFLLSLLKLFIGIVSNSVTIFFDAMNNMFDVLGSGLGAVGYGIARKKSRHFPNGYRRLDALISFIISACTFLFGGIFIFYSIERLLFPLPIYFSWLYFALLVVTVLIKLGMGIGYYYSYKASASDTMKSLYIDSFMDAVITGSVVVCYGIGQSTNTTIDAVLGIVLGVFMMVMTVREMIKVTSRLIDYNGNIDVDAVKMALVDEHIMKKVDEVTLLGDGILIVDGEEDIIDKDNIIDIEKKYRVKIYLMREMTKDGT